MIEVLTSFCARLYGRTIIGFFKEVGHDEIENEPTKDVYKRYQEYCLANNLQPMSNIEFSKQVKKKFDFEIADKKIDGKKYRIFVQGVKDNADKRQR
jgi:putative DNA primase/helicase